MPKDVDLGRALASAINEQFTGKIADVEFTYDTYISLADLPDKPYCWLSTNNSSMIRESRGAWRRTCELKITTISRRGPTDASTWIDEILQSFDMMIDFIAESLVNGHKPVEIESQERYSAEMFESNNRLMNESIITYLNI